MIRYDVQPVLKMEVGGDFIPSPRERKDGYDTWLQYDRDVTTKAGLCFPQCETRNEDGVCLTTWFVEKNDLHTFDANCVMKLAPGALSRGVYFHLAYDDTAIPDFAERATTKGDPLWAELARVARNQRVLLHPLSRELTLVNPVLPIVGNKEPSALSLGIRFSGMLALTVVLTSMILADQGILGPILATCGLIGMISWEPK
jgi:hypothetical protein